MNRKIPFFVIPIMLIVALCSCSSGNDSESEAGDVTVAADSVVETGAFKKSNGETCEMKVSLVVSYPQAYKDAESLAQLQQLFKSTLLKAQESASVKDAMKICAKSMIYSNTPSQYGNTRSSADIAGGDVDEIDIDRFESRVVINVIYNANDVITFCREESIDKNGQHTSTSHHYTSFDLKEMKKITLSDLFRDDCLDKVTAQLKTKLMDDKGASNDDELNEMGYFNLPNLSVTNNFFFTSKGVTWSYDPSVIAVASVGEPTINLNYDDLQDFLSDNSIINRL